MAQAGCVNGMLDTSKYNSPMPFMGLYIAAANLICFLLMAFDTFNGFRGAKPWAPYKLFSLNSFTLMLLSLATKLTFDVNDPMPREIDQLSKLTGMVLLCTSMGFFVPSLGTMRISTRVTNLSALTIIITIAIANVYLQMGSRAIFAFIYEHVIIMSCMVVLLGELWSSALRTSCQNVDSDAKCKELEKKLPSEGNLDSMSGLLKKSYVSNDSCKPQLSMSETPNLSIVGMACVLGSMMVALATLSQSLLVKESCDQASGYKWSMWWVIATQMLTVLMGSFSVAFGWF
eukprot:TRINITY_DN1199_c1_g1_i11.p1 TRINITY_DN1199_c1_g1~~TRINITY_DN1199_c1_g1_i11.p1  ORF type:complete len:288 (+),score=21.63 TRINITY_DN1199_c1_g1_i11:495-1358(+)